jgi:hypothetical protein
VALDRKHRRQSNNQAHQVLADEVGASKKEVFFDLLKLSRYDESEMT